VDSAVHNKAMAATQGSYTFASEPKAVATRRPKYRDPKDTVEAETLKLQQSIHFDRRVHRGNTYSTHAAKAAKDALDMTKIPAPAQPRRRPARKKEASPFDMELPRPERNVVNLLPHLVEEVKIVEEDTAEAQTDEFLPEPPPQEYLPQKTGIDAFTQVEDGELFNFNEEVEPLLDVLVNKTLEQSLMEVEEEHEIASMQHFKEEWYAKQRDSMANWQDQVKEEQRLWELKEKVVRERREQKKREKEVLLKLQALTATELYTPQLVPNAVNDLLGVCFPDSRELAIEQLFLPSIFKQVQTETQNAHKAAALLDEVSDSRVERLITAQSTAAQAQKDKWAEMCRQKAEEEQIRQGNIRIYVDDGAGGKVPVGPIQIASADVIEEVNKRVYEWLQTNETKLAEQMPYGIALCLDDVAVGETAEIFAAKAGQITMTPKEAPPVEEFDEEEGYGDADPDGAAGDDS